MTTPISLPHVIGTQSVTCPASYLDDNFNALANNAAAITDLASSSAALGAALIGNKRTLNHAPALNLHQWIDNGIADVLTCAIPSTFNFATDDAQPYIQNLIADLELIGSGYKIQLSGVHTYRLGAQIALNSANNTGLVIRDMPTLKYVGAAMNTGTQDNSSGALILFNGTDHSFGGIDGDGVLIIDGNSAANHGVYWAGNWNTGFKMRRIHAKGFQLDIMRHINSTTSGPVLGVIEDCTFFPASGYTFSGVNAVCGRYPINIALNNNVGLVVLRNINSDTGVNGFLGITGSTYAGTDIVIDSCRTEAYKASSDLIVTDYGPATNIGTITITGSTFSASGAGSINSIIRNKTASGARAMIRMLPVQPVVPVTNLYQHDADATKTVVYDNHLYASSYIINSTALCETLPQGANLPATPFVGQYTVDAVEERMIIQQGGGTRYVRLGNHQQIAPGVSPYTVVNTDTTHVIHNGTMATLTCNLPAISSVGVGWESPLFSTVQAGAMTVVANAADAIGTKAVGSSYACAAATGNTFKVVAAKTNYWAIMTNQGFS